MPMRTACLSAGLWALAAVLPAAAACKVTDPTGTPLNVRADPNGKVVGTLANGTAVTILAGSEFSGKKWVYLGDAGKDDRPIGWVFGDFVSCRGGD